MLCAKSKILLDSDYNPQKNHKASYNYFYSELVKLCNSTNTKVVIINYSNYESEPEYTPDLPIVNADSILMLELNGRNYPDTYHFSDPKTNKIFDNHPNPFAHKIIAKGIIEQIDKMEK